MKTIILVLLSISCLVHGMWFENDFEEGSPSPSLATPTIFIPPPLTKTESKALKQKENEELLQCAYKMLKENKSLNSPIALSSLLFGFQNCTLLTAASHRKYHQNILKLALDHGADPNSLDNAKNSPLLTAVRYKCAPNVVYLLEHGAKIGNQKLLHNLCSPAWDEIAPESTHKRVATLDALLRGGADPNETDLNYPIPFLPCLLSYLLSHFLGRVNFASEGPESQGKYDHFLDQRKQMIMKLLEAGLKPSKKDAAGKSDWEKIVALKDQYDSNLFNFALNEINNRKIM